MEDSKREELESIIKKVCNAVDNVTDYYLFGTVGKEQWCEERGFVELTVYWSSTKTGDDWEETWYIYEDGKISAGDYGNFDNVEQLERNL